MAQAANNSGGFVQGYWFLTGKPSTYSGTDEQWGNHMAQLAVQEASSYSFGIGLIYADVELGTWSSDTTSNYNIVKGFCNEIQSLGYTPGIYSADSQWSAICGSNSAQAIAPGYCWTSEPQNGTTTPPTGMADAQPYGGYSSSDIVVWQYYLSDAADYDVYVD